ncbi:MAG: DUF933 domain-containing protein, partial [Firmicutes bacterium]|nr:DUF933 domain-containing protein [Bacillota bacterium]
DMETVERRMEKTRKMQKSGGKRYAVEVELQERILSVLDSGRAVRTMELSEEEKDIIREYRLLTEKPVLYVANVDEQTFVSAQPVAASAAVVQQAGRENARAEVICAQLEAEIAGLEEEERQAFLTGYGLPEPALNRLIRAAYDLLGLQTFFTTTSGEVRAWTVPRGTRVQEAAGKIHTDMARGFIRAEIIAFPDLDKAGSPSAARDSGYLRLEGRDYLIRDGDVVYFRFGV